MEILHSAMFYMISDETDYLVENIKPTIESLQDLEEILMKDNPGKVLYGSHNLLILS